MHIAMFPGHALHEKDLQKQVGVGTLVNNQERTADKPVVNCGFCSPIGLHGVSFVRVCKDTRRRSFFHRLEGERGCLLVGK